MLAKMALSGIISENNLPRPFLAGLFVLILLAFFHHGDAGSPKVRVASFNIQSFGIAVMSQDSVATNIARVLQRYDLVLVMEVRDKSEDSLQQLRDLLGSTEWDYVASQPIGRTNYKEQYVYFYRPEAVKFLGAQFYDDSAHDIFEREPYIAQFQFWSGDDNAEANVTFVGVHIDPDDVPAEMEGLVDAISSATTLYPDSGTVITMGDFNADCSYMSCAKREEATLFSSPNYINYIPHKTDTTTSYNTNCAYDRIVLTEGLGHTPIKIAYADAYNFESGLGITHDAAVELSDHYPVEFTLE